MPVIFTEMDSNWDLLHMLTLC